MSNNLYRGSAIPDTSWRLRSYTLDPQAQVVRNLTRFTPFLYAPYAKSLCDGLNINTAFTNPYADGQPFTGTFYGVARTEGLGEDDRSLTIVQTLVPNKGEDKSVTWAENCKELRTIRYVERLTKAQLDIETATYAACSNGNNYMLDINRTDEGLWTLKVMIRTAQPVVQVAFTSLKAAMEEDETYREINKQTQTFDTTRSQGEILRMASSLNEFCYYDLERVKATSIAATLDAKTLDSALEQESAKVYRNSRTQIAAVASSQGTIYQAQQTPNADGTYDGNLAYRLSSAATMQFASERTAFKAEDSILYKNARTQIEASTTTGSGIYRADQSINQDGTYDGRLIYRRGTNQGVVTFESENSALQEEDRTIYRDWNSKVDAPASSQGTVYTATNELTEDGLYNAAIGYQRNSAATMQFASERTLFKAENSILYRNSRTQLEAPAATGSGIYRADQSFNQDGTYDGRLVYRCGTNQGSVAFESQNATLQEEDRIIYRDWNIKIDAPAAGAGSVYTATNELTEDGLYNASIGYQKNIAASAVTASMATPLQANQTTIYKSNLATIAVPGAVQGVVYDASQTLNTDGTYDGRFVSQTSAAAQLLFTDERTAFKVEDSVLYKNSRTKIDVPETIGSGIYRADQSMNQDGTYDGRLTYRRGTNAGSISFESQNATLQEEDRILYRDWNSKVDAPAATPGNVYTATNELTEDGLYNASIGYQRNTAATSVAASLAATLRTDSTTLYKNNLTEIVVPAAVQGVVYDATQALNTDGTYDGKMASQTSVAASVSVTSLAATLRTDADTIYKNSRSALIPPAAVVGTVYRSSQTFNTDGTYDGQVGSQTAVPATQTIMTEQMIGRTTTTDVRRNQTTAITAPAASAGQVYRATSTYNQDGTFDGNLDLEASVNINASTYRMQSGLLSETELIDLSRATKLDAPAAPQGTVYQATNELKLDGTYNSRLENRVSTEVSMSFKSEQTPFRNGQKIVYENSRTKIDAPAPVIGIYRANQTINQDGTYTGELTYIQTPPNATPVIFESVNADLQEENRAVYRDWATKIDAPGSSQGTIYEAANRMTDEGLYEATVVYRVSHEGTVPFQAETTVTRTENQIVYSHSKTVIVAPSFAAPGVYRATNTINEDGTYNGTLTYNKSTSATVGFASERSLFRVEDTIIYESNTAVIAAPTPVGPGIYAATQVLNPDGTYNGKLVYRQPGTSAGAEFESVNSELEEQSRIVYKNVAAPVTAAASSVGVIYQAANTISEDGTYDAAMTYAASKPADHTFVHGKRTLLTETMRMYRNSTTPLAGVTPSAGFTYTVNQSINQDGTYDGSVVYGAVTTLQPVVDSMRSVTGARFDQVYVGQTTVPTLPTPGSGGIYKASVNVSTDGTYEGRMMYEQNTAFDVIFSKRRGPLLVDNAILYRHWPDAIQAPTGVASTVYEVHQTLEDDGTYSGLLTAGSSVLWSDYKYRFPVYHPNESTGSIYQEVYCINSWDLSQVVAFLQEPATGGPNLQGTGIHMGSLKWVGTRIRNIASYV